MPGIPEDEVVVADIAALLLLVVAIGTVVIVQSTNTTYVKTASGFSKSGKPAMYL